MTTTKEFLAHVFRTYGVTPTEYRALYYAQGGRCYVCRKASGRTRRLGVDHNHLTGEVRGLVCTGSLNAMTCNRLIAIYGHGMLMRAAAMLSEPPPARAVLQAVRTGDGTSIPYLINPGATFDIGQVRGVDL